MEILNTGKLLIYYVCDGSGDQNFENIELTKEVKLLRNKVGSHIMSFEIDYPGLPIKREQHFNLNSIDIQTKEVSLYMIHTIKLSEDTFILFADLVYDKEDGTENF